MPQHHMQRCHVSRQAKGEALRRPWGRPWTPSRSWLHRQHHRLELMDLLARLRRRPRLLLLLGVQQCIVTGEANLSGDTGAQICHGFIHVAQNLLQLTIYLPLTVQVGRIILVLQRFLHLQAWNQPIKQFISTGHLQTTAGVSHGQNRQAEIQGHQDPLGHLMILWRAVHGLLRDHKEVARWHPSMGHRVGFWRMTWLFLLCKDLVIFILLFLARSLFLLFCSVRVFHLFLGLLGLGAHNLRRSVKDLGGDFLLFLQGRGRKMRRFGCGRCGRCGRCSGRKSLSQSLLVHLNHPLVH
mmetsp:Transcript_7595/g.17212  ORF Transcript_7595/g.17212 Transcript_7595/m.17212 type:complete len:297 (-) Transcript_7595:316-1206(-)